MAGEQSVKGGARRILEDLRKARVLVVHSRDEDGAALIGHLKRLGCEVRAAWPLPSVLPPDVDTLFVQIEEVHPDQLVLLLEERDCAIIAVMTYESPTSLKAIIDLNAHGVISKPLRPLGILTQFTLARYRHGYESRLAGKVRKLEDTLKGRRLVDKATRILAELNGVDEDAAYRMIRDQATAKRVTMATVAETVIQAHETMNGFGFVITPGKSKD